MLTFDEMHNKYKEYLEVLRDYKRAVMHGKHGSQSDAELSRIMNSIYKFMKEIAPDFYYEDNGRMDELYSKYLIYIVKETEYNMPEYSFIVPEPFHQAFSNTEEKGRIPNCLNDEDILDLIVQKTLGDFRHYIIIDTVTLENECTDVSRIIANICRENNIECKIVRINPGFEKNARLYGGYKYHDVCIVKLNSGYYLIDCTYRQFFTLRGNSLERIGIPFLTNTKPGIFMTLKGDRQSLANVLLNRGWIKLTPENIKNYFDGFTLSFRNGHYYEETGDYSYTTPYTSKDYAQFLQGTDNQVNHEGELVLKRQIVPCQTKKK